MIREDLPFNYIDQLTYIDHNIESIGVKLEKKSTIEHSLRGIQLYVAYTDRPRVILKSLPRNLIRYWRKYQRIKPTFLVTLILILRKNQNTQRYY